MKTGAAPALSTACEADLARSSLIATAIVEGVAPAIMGSHLPDHRSGWLRSPPCDMPDSSLVSVRMADNRRLCVDTPPT